MMKKYCVALAAAGLLAGSPSSMAKDHEMVTDGTGFAIISSAGVPSVTIDDNDRKGISIAVENFRRDMEAVSGVKPDVSTEIKGPKAIIVGTIDSKHIKRLAKEKKIDLAPLKGATEKYVISFVENPAPGVEEALVVAGSDRRGAIYGTYELSEQIGVSPWYWWADVPVEPKESVNLRRGVYTNTTAGICPLTP